MIPCIESLKELILLTQSNDNKKIIHKLFFLYKNFQCNTSHRIKKLINPFINYMNENAKYMAWKDNLLKSLNMYYLKLKSGIVYEINSKEEVMITIEEDSA